MNHTVSVEVAALRSVTSDGSMFVYGCPCELDSGLCLDAVHSQDYSSVEVYVCSDVDECNGGTDGTMWHDCHANATCTNTDGSFTCACDIGYEEVDPINGIDCSDIDECTELTDDCDVDATCTNTDGSFTCACNEGFVGDGVGDTGCVAE